MYAIRSYYEKKALEQTAVTLRKAGYAVTAWQQEAEIPSQPGIYLVHACHSALNVV